MVIAKIIPYMLISLICTAIVILLGIFMFNMPMKGSFALLTIVCILFMLTACSIGILISVITKTQQEAMLLCMLGLFLPALLLSGFIFPIENMPWAIQIFSYIVPAMVHCRIERHYDKRCGTDYRLASGSNFNSYHNYFNRSECEKLMSKNIS